jgi:hypothetical protein
MNWDPMVRSALTAEIPVERPKEWNQQVLFYILKRLMNG